MASRHLSLPAKGITSASERTSPTAFACFHPALTWPVTPLEGTHRPRTGTMEPIRLRVGRPITPEQFEQLSDEQLARLIPKAYREFFPGKDFCADGHFYLHDGTAWCFFRGGLLDE